MPEMQKHTHPRNGVDRRSIRPQSIGTGWHCWRLVASRSRRSPRCSAVAREPCGNYFKAELETGRGVKRAQNLERLEAAAKRGNVSAMKALVRRSIAANTRSRSPARPRRYGVSAPRRRCGRG